MENLSKEEIKNLDEEKDKIIKKNSFLRRDSTFEVGKETEEDKLKNSIVSNYTKFDLFKKAIKVSLLNWKFCLFVRIQSLLFDILDMYIPVQKGLIIDCITDKSKHHLLYSNFITVVKFILIKLALQITVQFSQIYWINESLYEYKDTLIEGISNFKRFTNFIKINLSNIFFIKNKC